MKFSRKNARHLPYGAAMATLLIVISIAVVIAFSLAGGSVLHLNMATSQGNAQEARDMADSVIAMAIDNYAQCSNNNEDISNLTPTYTIYENNDTAGPSGKLTYDESTATALKIPKSTNNINGSTSVSNCFGKSVPPYSLHLVGYGKSNSVTQVVEAIIHIPPFPYTVASSGKFSSTGDLLIGSVKSVSDIAGGLDYNTLVPGHLLSNNPADDAVKLRDEWYITGNVNTMGSIDYDENAGDYTREIKGEIRVGQKEVPINSIDLTSTEYDPIGKSGVQTPPSFLDNPTLNGYWRYDDPANPTLSIAGDLNLNGALLYVVQNLSIGDGVSGKGAIVVRGNLTIGRGASLSTDNQAALLCGGDVVIGGSGTPDDSSFQGLVYTKGSFTASNVSLFGTFLDGGGTSANMSFNNVRAVRVPEYSAWGGGGIGSGSKFRIGDGYTSNGFPGYHYDDLSEENKSKVHNDLTNSATGWSPEWEIKNNGSKFDLYQDGTFVRTFDDLKLDPTDPMYDDADKSVRGYVFDFVNSKWSSYVTSKYGAQEFLKWNNAKLRNPPYDYYKEPITNKSVIVTLGEIWSKPGNGLYSFFESLSTSGGIINIDLGQFLKAEDRMQILIWRSVN